MGGADSSITDNPAAIEKVLGSDALLYQPVAAAQWQEWRRTIDFVHRAKLKVLEHAGAHYWNIKAEVRPMLEAFFAKYQGRPAKELANLTTRLDFAVAAQSKLLYYSQPGWQRAIHKLMGKQ